MNNGFRNEEFRNVFAFKSKNYKWILCQKNRLRNLLFKIKVYKLFEWKMTDFFQVVSYLKLFKQIGWIDYAIQVPGSFYKDWNLSNNYPNVFSSSSSFLYEKRWKKK